ncbi:Elongation factor G-like protein [Rhodospirillaceae bacterium LM-1]|nr:Elongation factor G-like protein [Rhodospirillaceae bacterium LM-1]
MPNRPVSKPRVAALVGPYLSGKTSLLEALLFEAEAVHRKGLVKDGSSVGDASPEARARQMSTEVNLVNLTYLGDPWTLIDCPGSIELAQESMNALAVADVAVVVAEPDPARALMLSPLLKFLDDHKIPHILFLNKMDASAVKVRDALEALQTVSERPLVLREIPLRDGDKVTGYIDLVSERAYKYHPGDNSDLIQIPKSAAETEHQARQELLEHLADFDDHLMEELLTDVVPPTTEVYETLARDLKDDLIVPVFFGSAQADGGIRRLWKALRHEAPEPHETFARLGLKADNGGPLVQIFKTLHAAHTGKMSLARIWKGEVADGQNIAGARVVGVMSLQGAKHEKKPKAVEGEVVGLGRLESLATGQLADGEKSADSGWLAPLPPLFALGVAVSKKADEVKLSGALSKLAEEDPSLSVEHAQDTHETLLWGQGEIHLQIAAERLKNRFGLDVVTHRPQVPYKETIKKPTQVHGRHKRQSGGHGQFGDVHIAIKPQARGAGFAFSDTIVGGAIPKQYIQPVCEGAEEVLKQGPLGFAVVDLAVTLTDGSFHAVDSSDMAFKTAGAMAMREGLPQCEPVLLEPVLSVEIAIPAEHTSKAQRLVSSRRGQILGFDAKDGWKGWDVVSAQLPQAEMHDLIIELRSLTMGVGTFAWHFDHMQELSGRSADKVVEDRKALLSAARG